jgi:hypothetical protein
MTTKTKTRLRRGSSWVPLAGLLMLAGCGPHGAGDAAKTDEAWNPRNDPSRLQGEFDTTFAALPLAGATETHPWPDTYWPSSRGGLAYRWHEAEHSADSWHYELKPLDALRQATEAELAALSPAEKFDILRGKYDYPLVQDERRRTAPTNPSWFGLCHGWAQAALHFAEPHPITLENPDGIRVPFGTADVKALLTFAQQKTPYAAPTHMLGGRCRIDFEANPDGALADECRDTNAGSFHIILANRLGLQNAPLVADINRDQQVWNQPVYGFESRQTAASDQVYAGAAPGTVRIVSMETTMRYVAEIGPRWDPAPWTERAPFLASKTYQYDLELDAQGKIVGGEWRTEARPDFLWVQSPPTLTDDFAELTRLYQASTARE